MNKGYTRLAPGMVTKILAYRRRGYDFAQIARTLGLSKTTVKVAAKKAASAPLV